MLVIYDASPREDRFSRGAGVVDLTAYCNVGANFALSKHSLDRTNVLCCQATIMQSRSTKLLQKKYGTYKHSGFLICFSIVKIEINRQLFSLVSITSMSPGNQGNNYMLPEHV